MHTLTTLLLVLFIAWVFRPRQRHVVRPYNYRQRAYHAGRHNGITLDRLYVRDHGICGICHLPVARWEAQIDHIRPLARGGAHTWQNVQLAHGRCNARKGAKW